MRLSAATAARGTTTPSVTTTSMLSMITSARAARNTRLTLVGDQIMKRLEQQAHEKPAAGDGRPETGDKQPAADLAGHQPAVQGAAHVSTSPAARSRRSSDAGSASSSVRAPNSRALPSPMT